MSVRNSHFYQDLRQEPVNLFISYSHKDDDYLNQLKQHLKPMERQGMIKVWCDREIEPGTKWNKEISDKLETADIVLLLISPGFFSSDFCTINEMDRALEKLEKGEVRLIPVIIEPVDWHDNPFAELQVLPEGAKPVSKWEDKNEAWLNVVENIKSMSKEILESRSIQGKSQVGQVIPTPVLNVVGRHNEIERVVLALKEYASVAITGIAGVGKTTVLAFSVQKIANLKTRKYSHICFHRIAEWGSREERLNQLLLSLISCLNPHISLKTENESIRFTQIQRLIENQSVLLVVDNADDNESMDIVQKIRSGLPKLVIAVTSRRSVWRDFEKVRVKGLPDADGIILFKEKYENFDIDEASLKSLCRRVKGHPMMITHLALEAQESRIPPEELIKQLQELIEINKKLANPDTIDKKEAQQLIKKAKTFVLITCAIHATEIASTQMAMIFAHKLATTNDTTLKNYLDSVVILLMPSINPDGNIMVTDWYNKYLNSEFEGCQLPYLYHHYAGHDNNRDFYMLNLKETRVVNTVLHHRYFPHIFLDMHQMSDTGPRMFVPPFKDPLNQNLDPVLINETNIIGSFMALRLQENNKKGVGSAYAFDAYWPGGSKNTAWYKNVVGVLTEMASAKVASPIYIESNELQVSSKGLPEYKTQVNFPDPWPGGWWRLKDIIDYEMIAAQALLEIAAKNRESFLTNFYQAGLKNIKEGITQPPYGYVVPQNQWDTPAVYTFLQKMEEHGVRIYQLEADAQIENRAYQKGDFIIPMNQPYSSFIKVMLERQHYPEIKYMKDGPIIEPYDAAGWTMPLQMGVKTIQLNNTLEGLKLIRVKNLTYPGEVITGEGDYYCIPAGYNRSVIIVNRLQKRKVNIYRYTGANINGNGIKPGDFLVKTNTIGEQKMEDVLKGTGVSITKLNINKPDNIKLIIRPSIGIYQSYRASMDEGWTRWVLDHFEFNYNILYNKDFNEQELSKHHVIIFPDQERDTIVKGTYKGYALKKYVQTGGTIVLLDSAAELGMKDFALPFSNILKGVKQEKFYCPGSLLRLKVDPNDPIGWGIEEEGFIFFSDSPAFRTSPPLVKSINRKVVAGFNETGPHLLSGYIKGEKMLDRAVMIIRIDYHQGHVIVLGGRVQHRSQTFGTFKFLFNSLYSPGIF